MILTFRCALSSQPDRSNIEIGSRDPIETHSDGADAPPTPASAIAIVRKGRSGGRRRLLTIVPGRQLPRESKICSTAGSLSWGATTTLLPLAP